MPIIRNYDGNNDTEIVICEYPDHGMCAHVLTNECIQAVVVQTITNVEVN